MEVVSFDRRKVVVSGVLGLILFVLTLFIVFGIGKSAKKSKGQPTVLIVGPSYAGKTALYLRWQEPKSHTETVTSILPNESPEFAVNPAYKVIDCPGNEKLVQYTQESLKQLNVKAVIFVIDASAGVQGIKDSARALFRVLEVTESKLVPVLIAANKFDLFSALSIPKIKSLLEQEITELRDTISHTVPGSEEDTNWSENEREFLGVDGKSFEFTDLEADVAILDGSVQVGRIGKWETWLQEVL